MNKGYSPSYIKHKLYEKQVDVSSLFIDEVFAEHNITEQSQVDHIIKTKLPEEIEKEDRAMQIKSINKVCRFLASKGHNIDIYEYFSYLNL